MKQIGGERSTLFSLSATEKQYLQQAIALRLIAQPIETHEEGSAALLVRFRSLDDARHVESSIA